MCAQFIPVRVINCCICGKTVFEMSFICCGDRIISIFCLWWCLWVTETLSFYTPKIKHYPHTGNAGYPSILTPFIYESKIDAGQMNCSVTPLVGNHSSYAGYFTVRTTVSYTTNLFFWFFPAEFCNLTSAPVVLYMQGGTGVSCLVSVFEGIGPYLIDPINGKIKLNENRLTKTVSVLYIDHPPGSGYSVTGDDIGYSFNKKDTALLLTSAIRQFFLLFPELKSNHFYICGESYSSSYVPALAKGIFQYNLLLSNKDSPKINLIGVILGSTFFNPISLLSNYTSKYDKLGLLSSHAVQKFEEYKKKIDFYIQRNKSDLAFRRFDKMVLGCITKYPTLFQNVTNHSSIFNCKIPHESDNKYHDAVAKLIQSVDFRRALHIGDYAFNVNYPKVLKFLSYDMLNIVEPPIQRLLRYGFRVLIYHGQLDALVPYSTAVDYVKSIPWIRKEKFKDSLPQTYFTNNEASGYFQRYGVLMEVMLSKVGHMASKDQPFTTGDLIMRFINKNIF